ncbi:hypothetical protein K439DRAFT_1658299 [Ramaria rubella]|nr:hypothetical protein K439DRAFT_1658299 [Ramaria rubella]
MFLYDYYVTLPDEVLLIWQRPFMLSTALYFMIRYLLPPQIVFNLVQGLPSFSMTGPAVNIHIKLYALFIMRSRYFDPMPASDTRHIFFGDTHAGRFYRKECLAHQCNLFGSHVFLAALVLRTYAIYDRNKTVLIGLGSVGLAVIVIDFVPMAESACDAISALQPELTRRVELSAIFLRLAFEIILIVLTIWRTAGIFQNRELRIHFGETSLVSLILRSGLLSFCAAFILEMLDAISIYTLSVPIGFLNSFALPLSAIIMAHFLLNIRSYIDHTREITTLSTFEVVPRESTTFGQEFGDEILGGYDHY